MNGPSWDALIAEWLAGLFMAPLSTDTVESYRDGLGSMLLDALDDEAGAAPGARRMRLALRIEDSALVVQRGLAAAFTQLFAGVAGPRTVSLYESTRTGDSGRLFQRPVSDMNRLMRQLNVSSDEAFQEPPDHLSMELAVLGHLMRGNSSHGAQTALLDDHLLAWVPGFARECDAADCTGFYAGAAEILADLLSRRRMKLRAAADCLRFRAPGPRRGAMKPRTGVMLCRSE